MCLPRDKINATHDAHEVQRRGVVKIQHRSFLLQMHTYSFITYSVAAFLEKLNSEEKQGANNE
jgi:hypothetical protein